MADGNIVGAAACELRATRDRLKADLAAGIASLHPGIDFWRGCGRRKCGGLGGGRASVAPRRLSTCICRTGAMDDGRIVTDLNGVTLCRSLGLGCRPLRVRPQASRRHCATGNGHRKKPILNLRFLG